MSKTWNFTLAEGKEYFLTYADENVNTEKMTRGKLKARGGKRIAAKPVDSQGERILELWQLDDEYYIGDDWYTDSMATVYRAYKTPF